MENLDTEQTATADGTKADTPARGLKRKQPTKKNVNEDPRIARAFDIMQSCVQQRDSCDIYGEYVATKLRAYSRSTQNMVQHLFNNILFNADMGQYDQEVSSGLNSRTCSSTAFSPSSSHLSYQSEFDSRTATPVTVFAPPRYSTNNGNGLQIGPSSSQTEAIDDSNEEIIGQSISRAENAASYLVNFKPSEMEGNYTCL